MLLGTIWHSGSEGDFVRRLHVLLTRLMNTARYDGSAERPGFRTSLFAATRTAWACLWRDVCVAVAEWLLQFLIDSTWQSGC